MNTLPVPPGKTWQDKPEKTNPSFTSMSKPLSEMAVDYHFFNHGALFAFAGFDHDPLADWYAMQDKHVKLLFHVFTLPIFHGLNNPTPIQGVTWNNVILGVPNEYWESLWGFLGGAATIDRRLKRYCQLFSADVQIIDPVLAMKQQIKNAAEQTIKITVFCVDATDGRWECRPPDSLFRCISFVRMDPRQTIIQLGNAVLGGELEQLQSKENPAMKPLEDKFKALTSPQSPVVEEFT